MAAAATARTRGPVPPARVLMQDFTGCRLFVDLAACALPWRASAGIRADQPSDSRRSGHRPLRSGGLLRISRGPARNAELEFQRNRERYEFLRWGQQRLEQGARRSAATGIVHQVNPRVPVPGGPCSAVDGEPVLYPTRLVGTTPHHHDQRVGVLGWGRRRPRTEAVMLGHDRQWSRPMVIGRSVAGSLPEAPRQDLVLTLTEQLRAHGSSTSSSSSAGRAWRLVPCGSSDHRQHGAGSTARRLASSGRRQDPALPAAHRPSGGVDRSRGALHQGTGGPVRQRGPRDAGVHPVLPLDLATVEPVWPVRSGRGSSPTSHVQDAVPHDIAHSHCTRGGFGLPRTP